MWMKSSLSRPDRNRDWWVKDITFHANVSVDAQSNNALLPRDEAGGPHLRTIYTEEGTVLVLMDIPLEPGDQHELQETITDAFMQARDYVWGQVMQLRIPFTEDEA